MNLKELAATPEKLASGHRSCAGCGFPIIVRTILAATNDPIIVACATGCLEVTTTIYPEKLPNELFLVSNSIYKKINKYVGLVIITFLI